MHEAISQSDLMSRSARRRAASAARGWKAVGALSPAPLEQLLTAALPAAMAAAT
jgi:hypothetical protein